MNTVRLIAVITLSLGTLSPALAYNHHDAMHDAYQRALKRIEARQAERREREQMLQNASTSNHSQQRQLSSTSLPVDDNLSARQR